MRLIFLSKCLKLNVDSGNSVEGWEKLFSCWDNGIWIRCSKLSLLPEKYISSGVNVLANGIKISYITKKAFFQLNIPQREEQRLSNYWLADFTSVWDRLICWLSPDVLKRYCLDIYKSMHLAVHTFGKK